MAKRIGRDYKIGIAKETSRGTPVSPAYWIPRQDFDFEDKAIVIQDEQGYGIIEDVVKAKVVSKWAEGKIGGILRDRDIGLFLLNGLGQVSSTPYSGAYQHTFTVLSSHQHPSLSVLIEDPDGDMIHPLCMIKALEIAAELNEFVIFSADLIGKVGQTGTSGTPAYIAENEFVSSDLQIKFAATQAALGAASATKIKSATITKEFEIEKDDVLGSISPDDFLNRVLKVSVDIEKNYEDTTYHDLFISGTPKAFRLKMTDANTVIGTTNPSLQFDLNQAYITDYKTSKGLNDLTTETFTLKATFRIADASMIGIILVNQVASY